LFWIDGEEFEDEDMSNMAIRAKSSLCCNREPDKKAEIEQRKLEKISERLQKEVHKLMELTGGSEWIVQAVVQEQIDHWNTTWRKR